MEAADEETPLIHYLPPQDEGSQYTSDGTVDVNKKPALKRSTGNWRACYLILGSEINESLAFSGIQKNLVTYLTSVLHESNVDAAKNVSTWIGSCFFTPLIGAFLADTYWGRYWTVVIFISIQAVGMIALTVSAWLPLLMDSSFNSTSIHRAAVYVGLYLIAVGSGGIKPCTSALGADQFDGADPAERVNKGSFFNWFFFSINLGSLLSSTVLVWVQDNVGWGVGFAIPMALTVLGLAVFVAGRKVYRYKKLEGSPLTRVLQVVVAAVRNYSLTLPEDSSALHEMSSPNETNRKTAHTCQFRFFDKAAIVAPSSSGEKGAASTVSPWRLCTVPQVEELKLLLRMFPVWASMVPFFAVTSQASSTFIEQGMAMDNRVGPFTVPAASLATFHTISIIVGIPIYDAALVPLARRVTGNDRGLSQLRRLGVGLALSVAAMAYAALVEARRLAAASEGAMSIVWQAPSFAVLGAAEVFTTSGVLEFFYDQSPGGMKSLGTSLAHIAIAAGSYLNSAVLGAVAWATARGGAAGWIPDDLNEGHLDYFFWLMAALSVVNLLHFVHCSRRYRGNKTAY
ncbi:hypothetical protein SEVIR_5G186500v4 [Setaria viridis]|uniref:Major facilitator superfamily (MFS) profile domain-containing protein n=1 Tax=Setaria viridis TaxID=4556 RepID=A0A4U6UFL3_SETVI|nr:protein NRT1/ PTR FAMILY 8.3-like [Setaria viridis]XP_034593123.1 protein NRT1/ PTR FAMILY 8.3-like [Setaria viridis]XP_034593124.1 protein NRT1/ PTR FAMILY 8.3-like [Setaria viridis]XP_034593125.1 protein NRT1/ PTR FAMILY 8.3-like [Setaria viridis]TKW14748.1 hypothetical protein SEVIR_5G186500v2 [Setaria viridis]